MMLVVIFVLVMLLAYAFYQKGRNTSVTKKQKERAEKRSLLIWFVSYLPLIAYHQFVKYYPSLPLPDYLEFVFFGFGILGTVTGFYSLGLQTNGNLHEL